MSVLRSLRQPHPSLVASFALLLAAITIVVALAVQTITSPPAQAVVPEADRRVAEPAPVQGDESVSGPGTSAAERRARGEYAGPLVVIDGTGACPAVADAFIRMRTAAAKDRIRLHVRSGFRTRTHQARLYRELGPKWAARPGTTLHHDATELDIRMMPGAGNPVHRWLGQHAGRFGFVQRYSWEPWHWGFVAGC